MDRRVFALLVIRLVDFDLQLDPGPLCGAEHWQDA